MIRSIFFARFHSGKEGTRVLHQVPEGSIVPSTSPTAQTPLFDFSSISEYIIPRQEFCDRLVTVCINRYCVLGYPVCITNASRYSRNQFIFNFALVLEEDTDMSSYTGVVKKLAMLFRDLEEQDGFLSKEEERFAAAADATDEGTAADGSSGRLLEGGEGKVYALCEMILEDLNNYCECMIPIDESNTLNLKLFPAHRPPPPIYSWHVPLSTVRLSSLASADSTSSWDLTLTRIIPHINGISSLARIAHLADTNLNLTRKAVAHLAYYNCVILLDIFQFGAIYAPTADFGTFVEGKELQVECARYVTIERSPLSLKSSPHYVDRKDRIADVLDQNSRNGDSDQGPTSHDPAKAEEHTSMLLIQLYASLKQGLSLRNWCIENYDHIINIDVRRFITYGVIKGFLYRVHKYAIATGSASKRDAATKVGGTRYSKFDDTISENGPYLASIGDSTHETESGFPGSGRKGSMASATTSRELALGRYLDGMHCFDQICTEMQLSERQVMTKLKAYGDVQIVYR